MRLINNLECGLSDFSSNIRSINGKIVGGIEAVANSWPSQVFIALFIDGESFQLCGGTLINSKQVLTAAHCIIIPSESFYR